MFSLRMVVSIYKVVVGREVEVELGTLNVEVESGREVEVELGTSNVEVESVGAGRPHAYPTEMTRAGRSCIKCSTSSHLIFGQLMKRSSLSAMKSKW